MDRRVLSVLLLLLLCSGTVQALTYDELTKQWDDLKRGKDTFYLSMQQKFDRYCINPITLILLFTVSIIIFSVYTETVVKMSGSSLGAGPVMSILFIMWLAYLIYVAWIYMNGECTL